MLQHKIGYVFDPEHNLPIDVRFKIPTLSNQIDIANRYLGLVFFVEDVKEVYIYKDSLTAPIKFGDYINSQTIAGLQTTDYANLLTLLNNIGTKTLGSLVTIFPLKVTFVYTDTTWAYHSGVYTVTNEAQFNTIPLVLRADKKRVLINNSIQKIILANGVLSDVILQMPANPANLIDSRFYSLRGNLYFCISGTLFNIGSQERLIPDYVFVEGDNTIIHNLNSETLKVVMITENRVTNIDEFIVVDANRIIIESYTAHTADLLIQTL